MNDTFNWATFAGGALAILIGGFLMMGRMCPMMMGQHEMHR